LDKDITLDSLRIDLIIMPKVLYSTTILLILSTFGCSSKKKELFNFYEVYKMDIERNLVRDYEEFEYLMVGFSDSEKTVNVISKNISDSKRTSEMISLNEVVEHHPFEELIQHMDDLGLKEFEYLRGRHFLFALESPTRDYLLHIVSDNTDGIVEFDEFRGTLSYLENRSETAVSPYVKQFKEGWFYLKLGTTI
ncbi:MAG: hypothetical protein AAFR36_29080, partial [Bacteroidota bacterium]